MSLTASDNSREYNLRNMISGMQNPEHNNTYNNFNTYEYNASRGHALDGGYGNDNNGFEEQDGHMNANSMSNKNILVNEYSIPETTDMLVHMVANEDKLKNGELWKFSKEDVQHTNTRNIYNEVQQVPIENNELDDDINNYINVQQNTVEHNNNDNDNVSYFHNNNIQTGGDTFDLSDSRQNNAVPVNNAIPVGGAMSVNNAMPINNTDGYIQKQMSSEELALSKLDMLRKLAELQQSGVKLSQQYNMQSDLNTMKYEYELHRDIRAKQNGIGWMSNMMMNCIWGIEMLNESYNPFDVKLKGWSEQVNADRNNYYSVFGELYEKYNQPGKNMAPELKLLMMVSGSALGFHLQSSFMKNTSTLNDYMMNNPALAEEYRQRAISDKIKEQTIHNNSKLDAMMGEEHKAATQKASDLVNLKEKEMECLNMQRNQAKMDILKKKLSMTNNLSDNNVNVNKPINSSVEKMMNRLNNNVPNNNHNNPNNSNNSNNFNNNNNYNLNNNNNHNSNNYDDPNNSNNLLIKQQLEHQKRITEKQIELLDKQREAVEQEINMGKAKFNSQPNRHNTFNSKELYNNMKEFDNMSISSTKSEITIHDIKDIISKSNGNMESSDHHKVIQIDTVDEDDISFGTKSKRSRRSNNSRMSKVSVKKPSKGIVVDV